MIEKLEKRIIKAICENDSVYFLQNEEQINIDLRLKSEDNESLLMFSISDNDSMIYKYFIENGASLKAENALGESVLHSAIYSGKLERVKEVVDFVDINKKAKDGTTALLLAIGLENEVIANYLIENGANINLGDNEQNCPIHLASYFGLYSVVKNLVNNGAILNIKTAKGNFPLALAINEEHIKIVELLFEITYKYK